MCIITGVGERLHKVLGQIGSKLWLPKLWCCLHASSFIFDRINIKVAGNQDRHKSLKEFELDQNSGVHGNRKPQLTYNGENGGSTFFRLRLVRSSLYLQVTRTCIKSWTSSNFGQIGPLTTELAALEHLINLP